MAAVVKNLTFVLSQVRGLCQRHWNTIVGWLSFRAPPRGSQGEATPCSLQLLVAATLSWPLSSSLLLFFLSCSLPDRAVCGSCQSPGSLHSSEYRHSLTSEDCGYRFFMLICPFLFSFFPELFISF